MLVNVSGAVFLVGVDRVINDKKESQRRRKMKLRSLGLTVTAGVVGFFALGLVLCTIF